MKKQLLIACSIVMSTVAFTQQKFYSNNFTKEVTELNTSMKSVGFTTVLPESFKKYEAIVSVIDSKDEGVNDEYELSFYYNILPVDQVPPNRKVKYVIETGSDAQNDFTSVFREDVDEDFELFVGLRQETRVFRYQTIAVKVMGRTQEGMHWVNGEYKPKYRYENISFSEIKLDLGEPEPTFTTKNGLFTYTKYTNGKLFPEIVPEDETDDITINYEYGDEYNTALSFRIYEIKAGEIKQESFDMSGGAPQASSGTSVDDMIKEIKLNLKKSLIKSSCFNEARSVKLKGQRIGITKLVEGVYEPYMLDAEKEKGGSGGNALGALKSIGRQFGAGKGSNDKYNTFINSEESDLNWKKDKLGNIDIEMLELDLYDNDQVQNNSTNETYTLKDKEVGKTQKLFLFLAEVDGRLFVGTFLKSGRSEMTVEDLKFKDFIFSTFKVNS